jgi:putative Mg2+ transporter-C (MgtC) family protein
MNSWTFLLNAGVALALGLVIGVERQWRLHPAGLRTNTLVALGAALFVSLSLLMDDHNSPTRMASYVVSGLGFLGGGVILRDGLTVKGLNTAATLWCSGAVGTLAGSGYWLDAAIGTAGVLFVHTALRPLVHWIDIHKPPEAEVDTSYRLRVVCQRAHVAALRKRLLHHIGNLSRMNVQSMATEETERERVAIVAELNASQRDDHALEAMVEQISNEPEVIDVSWRKGS